MKIKLTIVFLLGIILGMMAGDIRLKAGGTNEWTRWDIQKVIKLLEKIESNLRR